MLLRAICVLAASFLAIEANAASLGKIGLRCHIIAASEKDSSDKDIMIDGPNGSWCSGTCLSSSPIIAVSSDWVVLENLKSTAGLFTSSVNRRSLTYSGSLGRNLTEGNCTLIPWQASPAAKF